METGLKTEQKFTRRKNTIVCRKQDYNIAIEHHLIRNGSTQAQGYHLVHLFFDTHAHTMTPTLKKLIVPTSTHRKSVDH